MEMIPSISNAMMLLQIRLKLDHTPSGRKVAMYLAIAIGNVNVNRLVLGVFKVPDSGYRSMNFVRKPDLRIEFG